MGGFPLTFSLAGAAFGGLWLWCGDAPHLSWVPMDNQGLGSVLRMVQGGTLCQGGTEGLFFSPVFHWEVLFVLSQPWALSLQYVVLAGETSPALGDTYCG